MKTTLTKQIAALAFAALLCSPATLFARERPQPSRPQEPRARPAQTAERHRERPQQVVRVESRRSEPHRPVACNERPGYSGYVSAPLAPCPQPYAVYYAPPPPPAPPVQVCPAPPPPPVQFLQFLLSF